MGALRILPRNRAGRERRIPAAQRLREVLAESGSTVETHVSRIRTDPWQFHVAQPDVEHDNEER